MKTIEFVEATIYVAIRTNFCVNLLYYLKSMEGKRIFITRLINLLLFACCFALGEIAFSQHLSVTIGPK